MSHEIYQVKLEKVLSKILGIKTSEESNKLIEKYLKESQNLLVSLRYESLGVWPIEGDSFFKLIYYSTTKKQINFIQPSLFPRQFSKETKL